MGVRYGWSTLLVIFLVVTGHLIYPLPTTRSTMPFSPSHSQKLYNISLNNPKSPPFYTNHTPSIQVLSHHLVPNSNKRSEEYTIEVLPSPRPWDPKSKNQIDVGIGVVVVDEKDSKESTTESGGKSEGRGSESASTSTKSTTKSAKSKSSSDRYKNNLVIDAQFMPWAEGLNFGEGQSECLDPEIIIRAARLALKRNPPPAGVTLRIHPPPKDFKCTERHAVEYFLSQLTLSSTRILIGGVEPSLCRVASHLAEKYDKLLILWSCLELPTSDKTRLSFQPSPPQEDKSSSSSSGILNNTANTKNAESSTSTPYQRNSNGCGHVAMVTPLANQVARSVRAALQHLGWKKISIITINSRYWLGVAQIVDAELRAWRHLVPAIQVLSKDYDNLQVLNLVKKVISQDVKALLMVLPSASSAVGKLMRVAGREGLTQHTALILVDPLLEPKPHYFPFSETKSTLKSEQDSLESDIIHNKVSDKNAGGDISDNSTASKSNVSLNNSVERRRNRTRGISVITEKDLQLTKQKYIQEQERNKKQLLENNLIETDVPKSVDSPKSRVKRSENNLNLPESLSTPSSVDDSEIDILEDLEDILPTSSVLGESDSIDKNNTSSLDSEDDLSNVSSGDSLENVMFKTPEHLASLPIEVARSVFLSVPKSIGRSRRILPLDANSTDEYPPPLSYSAQQSFSDEPLEFKNENDEILSRLTFDSVSLASHILRRNLQGLRLKMWNKKIERQKRKNKSSKKATSTSSHSEERIDENDDWQASLFPENTLPLRPKMSVHEIDKEDDDSTEQYINSAFSKYFYKSVNQNNNYGGNNFTGSIFQHKTRRRRGTPNTNKQKNMIKKKGQQQKQSSFQDKNKKVRDRIFFEVKRLQQTGGDKNAEERLENILTDGTPSYVRSYYSRRKLKKGARLFSDLLATKVASSTYFGAMSGEGLILASGKRAFEFLLLDWKPSLEALVPILRIHESNIADLQGHSMNTSVKVEVLSEIDWAFDSPIANDPLCVLLEVPCPSLTFFHTWAPGYLALLGMVLIVVIISLCTAIVFIRNYLRQKAMSKGPYKILLNAGDITLVPKSETAPRKDIQIGSPIVGERPDILRGSTPLVGGATKTHTANRLQPNIAHGSLREADEIRSKYNGDFVHMRYFYSPGNFEVKNKTMTLLKRMHDIRHENINSFLGLLCDNIRPGFVFDYCSRGSLEDIIKQKDIKLDWSFRLSLLTDLVRGMRYIHSSTLKCHGRLTSRNCVIDARWVLKITDYGLGTVYEVQNINFPFRSNRDLLWKAPELLRDESLAVKGSQAGDVFSFAIIMQEVVIRGEPYCMVQMTHPEILARLKKPPPMIRPSVSKGAAHPDVINIMKQCWAELPDMRPDCNQIYDLFKKLSQGRRLNIVDTMFQMLEKYSSNLEDLIRERTEQLHVEKKKTEQLLNRMLPSSVADQLKLGKPVAPEEFDEVTIYFSDIVGFTTISAYSTPFEVVDLLNDLYTAFDATINDYNVYKVETIGDAYMVVGGVPTRIEDHASQTATMALDLLHLSGKFRIRHLPNIKLMLRIGMHTGPCCAGVVGVTMPRYCLFGDTVNTASRMESSGAAWRIHVSDTTAKKLKEAGGYKLEFRGNTALKGKGIMPTYWLLGNQNFKKKLPVPPEIGQAHGLDDELVRQGRQHYTTRRDSSSEAISSAIKMYNQNRQKNSSRLQPIVPEKLTCPMSPFNSGLLPDRRTKRMMKICPIIVKIENYDSDSCDQVDNILRLSPLPQSPEKEIGNSGFNLGSSSYENKVEINERTNMGEGLSGYGGYNYLNPIRDSYDSDNNSSSDNSFLIVANTTTTNKQGKSGSEPLNVLVLNNADEKPASDLGDINSQDDTDNECLQNFSDDVDHDESQKLLGAINSDKSKFKKGSFKKQKESDKLSSDHRSSIESLKLFKLDRRSPIVFKRKEDDTDLTTTDEEDRNHQHNRSKERYKISRVGNSPTSKEQISSKNEFSNNKEMEHSIFIDVQKDQVTTAKIDLGKIKFCNSNETVQIINGLDPNTNGSFSTEKDLVVPAMHDQHLGSDVLPKTMKIQRTRKSLKSSEQKRLAETKQLEDIRNVAMAATSSSLTSTKSKRSPQLSSDHEMINSNTLKRNDQKKKRETRRENKEDRLRCKSKSPEKDLRSRSSSPRNEKKKISKTAVYFDTRKNSTERLIDLKSSEKNEPSVTSRSYSMATSSLSVICTNPERKQHLLHTNVGKERPIASQYSSHKPEQKIYQRRTFFYDDRNKVQCPDNQRSTSFQMHSLELPSPTESTML